MGEPYVESSIYSQQFQRSPGRVAKPRVVRSQAFEPGTLSTARPTQSKNHPTNLPPRPTKPTLRILKREEPHVPKEDNELNSYQEEIRKNIEKLINANRLPKLELRKNKRNEYVVSLEDLSLILATLVMEVSRKNELVSRLTQKLKSINEEYEKLKQELLTSKQFTKTRSPNLNRERNTIDERIPDALNELQRVLRVQTSSQLVQVVKNMTRVFYAIPQMEQFIKEVTNIVCNNSPFKEPDRVIPTLKNWMREKERIVSLRNNISKLLYGDIVRSDSEIVIVECNIDELHRRTKE